jgi:glycogen synthase
LRVLMTTDCVGGVWTYALELARALGRFDVHVMLATLGPPPDEMQRAQAQRLGNVQLEVSDYRLEWMEDPWTDVRDAGQWLLDLERQFRPNIVHLNGYAHGALPWRAPVVVVAHSCVLSWWMKVKGEAAPARWDHYRQQVTEGVKAADMIVAPTQPMLQAIQRLYGPVERAKVIHNGRNGRLFRPGRKEEFILAAGRLWDEAKNIAALEAVAGELGWPVCVAGDEAAEEKTRRQGEENGLVRLGRLCAPELAEWMSRASIYCLPARYEPFGLSALEAALSGCALVLGDIPSLREIWEEAAVYVPPDDRMALKEALQRLIADSKQCQAMACRARERAKLYTPQRMADGYFTTYAELNRPVIDWGALDVSWQAQPSVG